MDNSNPITQPPVPDNPQAVPPKQPEPVSPISEPKPAGSNNMVLWFAIGLVAVIVLVGGIYWFLSRPPAIPQQPSVTTQAPAPVAQENLENLENDLNSIDMDIPDSDFAEMDQDLQQL